MRVRKHFTVEGLTRLLRAHYGLPPCAPLTLTYQCEPLLHDRRLSSYGIGEGARLRLRVEPSDHDDDEGTGKEGDETASVASSSAASTALPDPSQRVRVRIRAVDEADGGVGVTTVVCSPLDTVGALLDKGGKEGFSAGTARPFIYVSLIFWGRVMKIPKG